jgi:hypothetical protein
MNPDSFQPMVMSLIVEHRGMKDFPKLADWFLENTEYVGALVDLATSEEKYPFPQYASWMLLHVTRKNFVLVEPFYNRITDRILTAKDPSVLRNLVGVSIFLPLQEYKQTELLDRLMALISDCDSKPGLIGYSIQKLTEYIELYPELQKEVEMTLEYREEMGVSAGVQVWIKRILREKKFAGSKRRNYPSK